MIFYYVGNFFCIVIIEWNILFCFSEGEGSVMNKVFCLWYCIDNDLVIDIFIFSIVFSDWIWVVIGKNGFVEVLYELFGVKFKIFIILVDSLKLISIKFRIINKF